MFARNLCRAIVPAIILFVAASRTCVRASLTYGNPFHPEQCDIAVAAAAHLLAGHADDLAAHELRAEGLLCRGLSADDPWALSAAIEIFEAQVASDRSDFFAKLYLAEALAHRFPLSPNAQQTFRTAAAALPSADVGAARAELATHIANALASMEAHRRQFQPVLDARREALSRGQLTRTEMPDLLVLLAETGPAGIDEALSVLATRLSSRYDPYNSALDTFYRAELLRGREPPDAVAALYRSAYDALCIHDAPRSVECPRIQWRLEQLSAMSPIEGGDR